MTEKEKRIGREKMAKFFKEAPKEVLWKLIVEGTRESMHEICMKTLKEKDCDLKLTGKCEKCYDYSAEQFILSYIVGKSVFDVIDDIYNGKFYNTWKSFLCVTKYIVEDGGEFHCSTGRGIEDIVNRSGISRKVWIKFLEYYFSER